MRINPDSYTWEQIADLTDYTRADLDELTAEWIGEPGYLDNDGRPTSAALDLLVEQARAARLANDPHADDPGYDSDFYEDN